MIDHGIEIDPDKLVECPMPNKDALFRDETLLHGGGGEDCV